MIDAVIPFYANPSLHTHVQFSLPLCLKPLLEHSLIRKVLLVDDGSPVRFPLQTWFEYGHKQKLRELNPNDKVQLIRIKHGGVAAARNAGVKHAIAPYILIVDSDIILSDYIIWQLWNVLETNPKVMFAGIDYHRTFFKHYLCRCEEEYWRNNATQDTFAVGGMLARREALQQIPFKGNNEDTLFIKEMREHKFTALTVPVHALHVFNPYLNAAKNHWFRGGIRQRDTHKPSVILQQFLTSPLFGAKMALKYRNPMQIPFNILRMKTILDGYFS